MILKEKHSTYSLMMCSPNSLLTHTLPPARPDPAGGDPGAVGGRRPQPYLPLQQWAHSRCYAQAESWSLQNHLLQKYGERSRSYIVCQFIQVPLGRLCISAHLRIHSYCRIKLRRVPFHQRECSSFLFTVSHYNNRITNILQVLLVLCDTCVLQYCMLFL